MTTMFELGQLLITPEAEEALAEASMTPAALFERHVLGDWGDLKDCDKQANELALQMGGRILSAYDLPSGTTIWVTTEPNRSATTICLPSVG